MRTQILLSVLFILFFISTSFSQKDTIWYNSSWKQADKKEASYYRSETSKKGDAYWIVDNYLNGVKQMEGLSLDPVNDIYQGKIIWYFQNGNKFQVAHYQDGILNGHLKVYFENGKLKSETEYIEGKQDGKWKEHYENGNLKETGFFEKGQKNGSWTTYYTNGKINQEGKYSLDKKIGVWKTNYYDGATQKN